jgi:hypothetical protein
LSRGGWRALEQRRIERAWNREPGWLGTLEPDEVANVIGYHRAEAELTRRARENKGK